MNSETTRSTYLCVCWGHLSHFVQDVLCHRCLSLAFWTPHTGVASAFLSKLPSQTNPQPQSCSRPNCLCKSTLSFKAHLNRAAGHLLLCPPLPSEEASMLPTWPLSCLTVLALPSVVLFSLYTDGNPFKGREHVHFVSSIHVLP